VPAYSERLAALQRQLTNWKVIAGDRLRP